MMTSNPNPASMEIAKSDMNNARIPIRAAYKNGTYAYKRPWITVTLPKVYSNEITSKQRKNRL